MMTGNETTRRRRSQGRAAETSETSSSSANGRSSTAPGHNQQPLHHHLHDHHHHHYHYHHHYHHFLRPLNNDQDQSLVVSSGSVAAPGEAPSQPEVNYTDQPRRLANNRSVFTNGSQISLFPSELVSEDLDQLDERLRTAATQSHRPGSGGNIFEEFSLLFEDDEDSWSGGDELLERGIEEWLAAVGLEEGPRSDVRSLPGQGLSRALIRRLQKVVFMPKGPRVGVGGGTDLLEQEDCSVCLEHFVPGQQLICLPCKHRFHADCLTPWLESHAKCPYCRARVSFNDGGGAGAGAASSSQTGNGRVLLYEDGDVRLWMEAVDRALSQGSER